MNDNLENTSLGIISSLEEVDENEISEQDDVPPILYHEKVLVDLFGKRVADSFLHPVIDNSIGVAGMSASIKSVGKRKIHRKRDAVTYDQTLSRLASNAERLWKMLRENSNYNIKEEDKKIAEELKMSFDSFARSCLNKNMTPPERSFVENKELKEMANIIKNKKVEKLNLERRKKQLMFNLSRVQEGNQIILMKEKSFLDTEELNCGNKELFFPPIFSGDASNVTEYSDDNRKQRFNYHKILSDLQVDVVNEKALFDVRQNSPMVGLKFFTEEDSLRILNGKREFQTKIKNKTNQNDSVMDNIIDKSRKWMEDDRIRSGESFDYLQPSSQKSEKRTNKQYDRGVVEESKPSKPWQPLTLGALMDFKITRKPTFLEDREMSFRQGSVKLWRPKLTQV